MSRLTKRQLVEAWGVPHRGWERFWDGLEAGDSGYSIQADSMLSGSDADHYLFGVAGEYELWYLSATDEVWVYLNGRYYKATQLAYETLGRVDKALVSAAGEPLARWPCPDTPQELRTLCQMFYQLQGHGRG